jgi:hypothetical protein
VAHNVLSIRTYLPQRPMRIGSLPPGCFPRSPRTFRCHPRWCSLWQGKTLRPPSWSSPGCQNSARGPANKATPADSTKRISYWTASTLSTVLVHRPISHHIALCCLSLSTDCYPCDQQTGKCTVATYRPTCCWIWGLFTATIDNKNFPTRTSKYIHISKISYEMDIT